jgi:hypothetical protein
MSHAIEWSWQTPRWRCRSVIGRLVETRCTLLHHSSGRQGGEFHSKLDFHTTKKDLSSTSLHSSPILIVSEIVHVLFTGCSIGHLCIIRRQSTIRPDSRLVRTNRERWASRVASELTPQLLTIKTHMKHPGPLPKVGVIECDIWERDRGERTLAFSIFLFYFLFCYRRKSSAILNKRINRCRLLATKRKEKRAERLLVTAAEERYWTEGCWI